MRKSHPAFNEDRDLHLLNDLVWAARLAFAVGRAMVEEEDRLGYGHRPQQETSDA